MIMKKKNILLCSLMLMGCIANAQSYTEHLERQGNVVVSQSGKISDLVNNKKTTTTAAATPAKPDVAQDISEEESAQQTQAKPLSQQRPPKFNGNRKRYNSEGYRIQVFTGGNSRADKQEAAKMQSKVRSAFPEISTYVHFVSPHWVCRVGDFKTREEAMKYVRKIRARGFTYEARLVKSNIFVAR